MMDLRIKKTFGKRSGDEITDDQYARLAVLMSHFPEWAEHYRATLHTSRVTYEMVERLKVSIGATLDSDERPGVEEYYEAMASLPTNADVTMA